MNFTFENINGAMCQDYRWKLNTNFTEDFNGTVELYNALRERLSLELDEMRLKGGRWIVKQPLHIIIVYGIAYSLIFLIGLFGNVLVVWIVCYNRAMHNVTNYLIVNLALADILVCLFCLPITLLSNVYSGWNYGAFMCKAVPFLQGVSVSASVNTLMAIAVDRYLAICHSMKVRVSSSAARIIIIIIWLFAALIMSPWAIKYQQCISKSTLNTAPEFICMQFWTNKSEEAAYFLFAIFLTCYTIPLICICVCYLLIGHRVCNRNAPGLEVMTSHNIVRKSKVKVIKMLVVVVIVFTFSWLPLYVVNLWLYYGQHSRAKYSNSDRMFQWLVQIIIPVIQWSGSSNSCVNPIIYCFFSRKFREGFLKLACSGCLTRGTTGRIAEVSTPNGSHRAGSKRLVYRFGDGRVVSDRRKQKGDLSNKTTQTTCACVISESTQAQYLSDYSCIESTAF